MTLITSISGIRGTIGGRPKESLSPIDVVKFVSSFASILIKDEIPSLKKIVIGRDGRISGNSIKQLAIQTLINMGYDVIDTDLTTTPTLAMAVKETQAMGGIMITASHNPIEWNALKFFNQNGEFISQELGEKVLKLYNSTNFNYVNTLSLGHTIHKKNSIEYHIQKILDLPIISTETIRRKNFKISVDGINSTGGIAVPLLLEKLSCEVIKINCNPNGQFAHNPEPLEDHLTELSKKVTEKKCHVGFAVDPDVDRLAIISEDGSFFGEEYTLVACAEYVLSKTPGNTVSNLSSTRALKDITLSKNGQYTASPVGEVNVAKFMKETNAIIGGEGNGGVIYPSLHYGRDALIGIALFLSALAEKEQTPSELRKKLPQYTIKKSKIESKKINFKDLKNKFNNLYPNASFDLTDGLKIDLEQGWIHLRTSNTEPIIRIYAEASSDKEAQHLIDSALKII